MREDWMKDESRKGWDRGVCLTSRRAPGEVGPTCIRSVPVAAVEAFHALGDHNGALGLTERVPAQDALASLATPWGPRKQQYSQPGNSAGCSGSKGRRGTQRAQRARGSEGAG